MILLGYFDNIFQIKAHIFTAKYYILEQLVFWDLPNFCTLSTRLNAALLQPKPNLTGSLSLVGFWHKSQEKDVLSNNYNKENKFIICFLISIFNQNSSNLSGTYYMPLKILDIVWQEQWYSNIHFLFLFVKDFFDFRSEKTFQASQHPSCC